MAFVYDERVFICFFAQLVRKFILGIVFLTTFWWHTRLVKSSQWIALSIFLSRMWRRVPNTRWDFGTKFCVEIKFGRCPLKVGSVAKAAYLVRTPVSMYLSKSLCATPHCAVMAASLTNPTLTMEMVTTGTTGQLGFLSITIWGIWFPSQAFWVIHHVLHYFRWPSYESEQC